LVSRLRTASLHAGGDDPVQQAMAFTSTMKTLAG
jgi:hypothetical protein